MRGKLSREEADRAAAEGRKLFVGGMPYTVTENEIRDAFAAIAPVLEGEPDQQHPRHVLLCAGDSQRQNSQSHHMATQPHNYTTTQAHGDTQHVLCRVCSVYAALPRLWPSEGLCICCL